MVTPTTDTVFPALRDCFCEALGLDEDEIELTASVIDDLGAESLDLLDIVFRLERTFDIKVPRGDLERRAQEDLGDEVYEVDGVLTPAALARLRIAMPEVPADRIVDGLTTRDIPRLFTVETFQKIVIQLLEERARSAA